MMTPRREVQYLVLPNLTRPYLLARVRWPDIFQAISPARPGWQEDPGLFDLPYAAASTAVTFEQAMVIANEWGAQLPTEDQEVLGPSLIRRMPSDWGRLSPAERRSWAIVIERAPRAHARPARWSRRRRAAAAPVELEPIQVATVDDAVVIDLDERRHDDPSARRPRPVPTGTEGDVMVGNA